MHGDDINGLVESPETLDTTWNQIKLPFQCVKALGILRETVKWSVSVFVLYAPEEIRRSHLSHSL